MGRDNLGVDLHIISCPHPEISGSAQEIVNLVRLPGIQAQGPDIGYRMRQSPLLKDVAIVLMTAYHLTPKEERKVIERAGADILLYKPLPSPTDFQARLKDAINHHRNKH